MPDATPPIRHPSRFVPLAAIATGDIGGDAIPVSILNPLPSSDQPLRGAVEVFADTPVKPGLAILIECSAAGIARIELEDGSFLPLSLVPGTTLLPLAVRRRLSGGTTATFSAWVLS